ncbi:MAG: hypothetical protein IT380_09905 [Myxococcales bacterium]|nr:hypothetical protein [Myxococcales bacterium]
MTEAILSPRPPRQFTDDDRRAIAVGWRSSGLSQNEYATQHGVKGRTLRLWLREHAPTMASPEEIRAAGQRMLDALRCAAALLEDALGQLQGAERLAVKPAPPDDGAASMTITTPRAISRSGHSEPTEPKRTGRYLFDDDE